jgi:hypothetical protein
LNANSLTTTYLDKWTFSPFFFSLKTPSLLFYAIVDECEILAVPPPSKSGRGVQKTKQTKPKIEVVTVEDPITGEPVKQLLQTVTDAKTGKTIQIPLPMANIQADNLDEGWIHIHIFFTIHLFSLFFSLI